MSDYLTNIAAKALNLMPVVRPRLASLYEAAQGMGGPSAGHILAVEPAPPGRPSGEVSVPPSSTPQPQGKGEGIHWKLEPSPQAFAALVSASEADETFANPRRSPLLTPYTTESGPGTRQPLPTPRLVQPPLAVTRTSSVQPLDERPSTDSHAAQFASDQGAEHAVWAPPQNDVEIGRETVLELYSSPLPAESLTTPPDVSSPRIGHGGEPIPRSTPRATIAVRAVAQPQEGAWRESDALTGGDSTTTPAPVIRVSIGRVEVRAIMPPAAPAPRPKAARPSPGLSLEEYLKQGRRGQQ